MGAHMITLGDLLRQYLEYLGARSSRRTYENIYRRYFALPDWADRPANLVTRYDVLLLRQTLEAVPSQADKALSLIKQAYRWANDRIDPGTRRPIYEGENPAWRIAKHDYIARERVMTRAEIRALLHSIDFLTPKYQAFFVCRILVPCRITELCSMRRDAVDPTGKWFKRLTKNKRPQYVQVPRQAMNYLSALHVEGDYYFMGAYGRPLQGGSARKVWARLRAELEMPDLWLLDFRRTLASYLYNEIKADDLTAKAVLNHYDSRPVAIYTRLNYEKLAEIIQSYADWMWQFRVTDPREGGAYDRSLVACAADHTESFSL